MNIAVILRHYDMKAEGHGLHWNDRFWIGLDYIKMSERYGVGMIAIMNDNNLSEIASICDGLIIPGSATNIDPRYYNGPTEGVNLGYDEYKLDAKIMDTFMKQRKPIFGICGGHQVMNIFLGGTIKRLDDPIAHRNGDAMAHKINIKKGSFVYDVHGSTEATVNNYHGWELGRLADGLDVVATTDDGVAEAIEDKSRRLFATQYHPELCFHTGNETEAKYFENFFKLCGECK